MPYALSLSGGILKVEFSGTLTNRDLSRGADELERFERASIVVPHRISDLRPVQRLEINFEGVYALAMARRRLHFPNEFKSAIVARKLVHYGFARMFQTLNDHPQMRISIFGSAAAGLEWLQVPGNNPPSKEWQPPLL